jgi:hypothetical protein
MHNTRLVRRYVLEGAAGYVVLSMLCVGLGHVKRIPSEVQSSGHVALSYKFFILGPPVALTAGSQGLPLYAAETIILIGLVWIDVRLFRRPDEAFAIGLLTTGAFWIGCGFLSLIFAF